MKPILSKIKLAEGKTVNSLEFLYVFMFMFMFIFIFMHHVHAAWTCSEDKLHGHAAWTCSVKTWT
jgi:hypothetical protein